MVTRKEKIAEFGQGYNVIVTGRHVHVTDGMKQHAVDRISKLDRIGDKIIDVHVTMDIQKLANRVDVMMKYGHTIIKSHASTTDMYVSIDQAVDKLNRQLKRYKRRLHDFYTKPVHAVEIPVQVYAAEEIDEFEEEKPHRIVATETRKLKVMSEDDAIMKMELSGDPLLVFRSETNRKLKVIFRREDGNYSIIEPEG
jgi:putative sigma-54 modulation protein